MTRFSGKHIYSSGGEAVSSWKEDQDAHVETLLQNIELFSAADDRIFIRSIKNWSDTQGELTFRQAYRCMKMMQDKGLL